MTVGELINILNKQDKNKSVVFVGYGESEQSVSTFEVDIEILEDEICISRGRLIEY